MAVNIIVYSNNIANAASSSYWGQLEASLRLNTAIANANFTIYLNENGEYSGVSPQTIANEIYNGAVWIDWCGWPLWYNDINAVLSTMGGGAHFGDLMTAFGYQMGYQGNSYPSFSAVPSGFPYLRSLVVSSKPQNPGFIANPNTPSWTTGGDYTYSSFAVRYGAGAYIYAVGLAHPITDPFCFFCTDVGATPNSVTPAQYIPFVKQILDSLVSTGSVTSQAPQCSSVGSYVGNSGLSAGFYYYTKTANGVTRRAVADSNCDIQSATFLGGSQYGSLSQAQLSNIFANGSATASGGTTSSTPRGKCTGKGIYMGPGNDFGSYAGYDVYKQTNSTGYVYNVVNPTTCHTVASYPHSTQVASTPAPTTGGTSTKPSTGVPPISNTTWLLAGGVGLAGLAWLFWPRKES